MGTHNTLNQNGSALHVIRLCSVYGSPRNWEKAGNRYQYLPGWERSRFSEILALNFNLEKVQQRFLDIVLKKVREESWNSQHLPATHLQNCGYCFLAMLDFCSLLQILFAYITTIDVRVPKLRSTALCGTLCIGLPQLKLLLRLRSSCLQTNTLTCCKTHAETLWFLSCILLHEKVLFCSAFIDKIFCIFYLWFVRFDQVWCVPRFSSCSSVIIDGKTFGILILEFV